MVALRFTGGKSTKPFRGIFTIPSTPFHENGQIDIDGFRRIIDFCVAGSAYLDEILDALRPLMTWETSR